MRAIVQRVSAATVTVYGREIGRCGYGLLLLVGVHRNDTEREASKLADKISTLRIFNDADGKMNLALLDFPSQGDQRYEYDVLAVSNFTVYGDTHKNRRPSFVESASYDQGELLFNRFIARLREIGLSTQTGQYGAHMLVSLINDGPVTLTVDIDAPPAPTKM
jgi:D-aminoacyl-tRNA deacylase